MNDSFALRHLGPRQGDVNEMLDTIGVNSLDQLIDETVPQSIRLKSPLDIPEALSEHDYLTMLKEMAGKNEVFQSHLGMGYYGTIIPAVTLRNVLENPGWYTAYTPYQAEIAQGRLEALLNFQTVTSDLTGLPIANASLLDEGTAAAESMFMFFNSRSRAAQKAGVSKFFVSNDCFPQTIDILKTRAIPVGIELVFGDHTDFTFTDEFFGGLVQYPSGNGTVHDFRALVESAHSVEAKIAVATDLMALVMLTPPGEWGADAVFGNSQRFGVPMGFGGPHAAFFATKEEFKRNIPGRIIGVSVDRSGKPALRMALQTREQHIKRAKATSNICTAQALLAVMASMYACYHGPKGLKRIAGNIHSTTVAFADAVNSIGYTVENNMYFDTVKIALNDTSKDAIRAAAEERRVNIRYFESNHVGISIDETTGAKELENLIGAFADAKGTDAPTPNFNGTSPISGDFSRTSDFLTHPTFNSYHSETEMMRYLKKLENRDLSLTHSMIPLGSCTMKLNAASELIPITWPEFANMHPFAPDNQTVGYREMIEELDRSLSEITGFHKVCMQPNSGAQGEYAGLMVIRAYHHSRGDHHRDIVLIPTSAHGTNPASAVMAGMKVVLVKCDDEGNIDVADLREKAEANKENLSALMVTYPSTHGVYEEAINEITGIVHEYGGQVYMDGANMNAQVGLTNPGNIGADVCHLNLHKTFAIPHGGGGPGMGPIGVAKHLAPFIPGNPVVNMAGEHAISAISAAPWGSALILLISYGYIKMLGREGVTDATRYAILNANYIKARIASRFDILYQGSNGHCAHEMIVDCRGFKKSAGVEVEDIAKRLIDYGFHAPTVSFPVAGTIMVEPTESESKGELDRFCEALLSIRDEIDSIEKGIADPQDNVLKNAPHTAANVMSDSWNHSYTRQNAAMPISYLQEAKFWPFVNRIDNAHGDRNLICTCPPLESYMEGELA